MTIALIQLGYEWSLQETPIELVFLGALSLQLKTLLLQLDIEGTLPGD